MSPSSLHHYIEPGDKLWNFVSNVAMDENLELYDLLRPRQNLLRVFIDKRKIDSKEVSGGVTSGDCSNFCRRLMHSFMVEGVELGVGNEPELEVSSPGLERELRLPTHFSAVVGKNIKLVANDKYISGILEDFRDETLFIRENENKETKAVNFNDVRKGQLIFN